MGKVSRSLTISLAALLAGCGAFDSDTLWKSGRFHIFWIDSPSNVRLSYDMGSGSFIRIIGPCIFAVGENRHFIVVAKASQHESGSTSVFLLNKDKYDPAREPQEALEGPFTEHEYQGLTSERSLPMARELFSPSFCRSKA
jgi:hypothetical protein